MVAHSTDPSPWLSIIVPVWREGPALLPFLEDLADFRRQGAEVILARAEGDIPLSGECAACTDVVITAPKGRARQMNAGASVARGKVLLFLHADTQLPRNVLKILRPLAEKSSAAWGRFDVRLSGKHPAFRVIERMISWRSRMTGIATGDQAIFVKAQVFRAIGGFPDQPLMEDIEICRTLKSRYGRPFCIREPVLTSSRKWEQEGILRTIWLMWSLKLAYYRGASPDVLVKRYYGARYQNE